MLRLLHVAGISCSGNDLRIKQVATRRGYPLYVVIALNAVEPALAKVIREVAGRRQTSAGAKGVFLLREDDLRKLVSGIAATNGGFQACSALGYKATLADQRLRFQVIREQVALTGVSFISTEISLARTFLDRAATTRIPDVRERNRDNAQAAHDVALLQLKRWHVCMGQILPIEFKLALTDLQQKINDLSGRLDKVSVA